MVSVKLIKKIGRLGKGTIGRISDREFQAFGVGSDFIYPHKCAFFVDDQEASIENIFLEVVKDEPKQSSNQRKPARQQINMSFA